MYKIIILAVIFSLTLCQSTSTSPCTCTQLLSEGDCTKNSNLNCAWDATKKLCILATTPITPTEVYATYCQDFTETDCPKAKPCETCGNYAACQWLDKKCSHFTGCTAHQKTTDGECQAISNKCITDGVHCVELGTCDAFLKQLPCKKNSSGKYCYWNSTDNKCQDASTCDKLPAALNTDVLCRTEISTCTTTATGGCVDSGTGCADQKLEVQCVWNKAMSQACYWVGNECKDKICDNAPTSMTTDDACKGYISTCTTKQGGGCVTRTTCGAALIQAACVKSSGGLDCYWNGTACLDKVCTSAPTSMTTNTACAGFKTNCITKNGGGCVENGLCSAANIAVACVKNTTGVDCIFDNNTCKEKTCTNAPTSNNTHELCQSFLSSCTVKSGGGCQPKTCTNAPTTLTSNSDCETFLAKNNCIAKQGGGCEQLSTCSSISLEANCTKNLSGGACVFNGTCKDKTCSNSPDSNNTHDLCNAYLSSCTAVAGKCVDKTCENTLTETICTTDLNNKACLWKGKCFAAQCIFAPSSITSALECNDYKSTCTLSNQGYGCMEMPLKCEAFTSEGSCSFRKNIVENVVSIKNCGWNGTTCVDKSCATAPKTIVDNDVCAGYLTGCVLANSGTGCQDLPATCGARKQQAICTAATGPACVWNGDTSACVDKTCATATTDGIVGKLETVDSDKCAAYNNCILTNDGSACMAKPATCNGLGTENCDLEAKADGGNCLWSEGSCKDYICVNLLLDNQAACQQERCALKNDKSGCWPLQTACSSYTIPDNCVKNAGLEYCKWNANTLKCEDAPCTDAPETALFSTNSACQNFPSTKGPCTVVARMTSTGGCAPKLATCSQYTQAAACHKTLGNLTANDDCKWNSVSLACEIKTDDGGNSGGEDPPTCNSITVSQMSSGGGCGGVNSKCKANEANTGCTNRTCDDYTSASDGINTNAKCQEQSVGCVINATGSDRACQAKSATCSGYLSLVYCTFSSEGTCVWSDSDECVPLGTTVVCSKWKGVDAHCKEYSNNCQAAADATNNTACVAKACSGYSGGFFNWTECQLKNAGCSPNNNLNACVDKKATCAAYDEEVKCVQKSDTAFCDWNAGTNGCVDLAADAACNTISMTNVDTMCEYRTGSRCTYQTGGNPCQIKQATCNLYTTQNACTKAVEGSCYWNNSLADGSKCFVLSADNCAKIVEDDLTNGSCSEYYDSCVANRAGTACQKMLFTCDLYTNIADCTVSQSGRCVQSQALNSGATCKQITESMTCGQIFPGQGVANDILCNRLKEGCTNNGENSCADRTCINATNGMHDFYSESICTNWKSGCVPNAAQSACISPLDTCASYTTLADCFKAKEGYCQVVNNKCSLKSCSQADPSTNTTHDNCEGFLFSCTIARPGGCQARMASCSSYISAEQCKYTNALVQCHWNVINKTCVENKCENYEANTSFDTAAECEAKFCVIKSTGSGCQARGSCGSYNQTQCTINAINSAAGRCAWNANLETPACQDKSCATAPNSFTDDSACRNYLEGCSIGATVDAATSVVTYGGCIPQTSCSSYIAEQQCTFSDKGTKCGWNGSKCDDFSCLTAPETDSYNTHDACHSYKSGCTVNSTMQGCIPIPDKCEGMNQEQCLFDKNGKKCYWVEESSSCITRSCDNAPSTVSDAAGCDEYLVGCTMFDDVKCKTKVCEDFVFTTDSLCKAAMSTCTTDGVKCVTRGSCLLAQAQAGCVQSSTNQDCEWVVPATGTPYCTIKNCGTAPNTLTSESSCLSYYPGCTTKKDGGCVVKSTCSAATVQSACTKSSLNVDCAWDVDKCRDKDCQDFSGKTHLECKNQRSNCTAGLNGKCARIQTCENTQVHSACIEGTNGPCLWVSGACYNYYSCKSLSWVSNSLCKQISSQCTTDGTKCVGITSCAETNVSGGCVTGYDGDCIQSVPSLDSTDTKCKLYTSCADAFYLTHTQCQTASYKCTTNKTTGCIPLSACSTYTNDESCKINDKGTVLTNNKVTSTGVCTWDATASTCKDQVCADLTFTTHSACNSTLSTCTSDGTNCINQGNCLTYTTDSACNNGLGLDGACFWVAQNGTTAAVCRVKTCDDVQNGTTTSVCSVGLSSCISDGTKCVSYSTCSNYKTQVSCNSGGSDGICFWKSTTSGTTTTGTCGLMTSCASAANDQIACNAVKQKCNWTPEVTGAKPVASKCETHTCATYQQTNGQCSRFFSWDSKLQQICTTVNGVCQATDPTTLAQGDCYNSAVTGYTYTWNASTSKCGVCTNPTTTPNTTNNTNTTNSTTESGQIVSVLILALSYVLI